MNCPLPFTSNYMVDALKILESAAKQSLRTEIADGDEDTLAYLLSLRETLIECYTTIVHGVKLSANCVPLIQNSQNILQFLCFCLDDKFNPSKVSSYFVYVMGVQNIMKSILGLVGDIADCIGKDIQDFLRSDFIERLIVLMRESQDHECVEIANWAYK